MAPKLLGTASEMSTMADFSLSFISTVYLSRAFQSATWAKSALPYTDCLPHRAREATTSSEVISLPLWNLTPCRSLKV